MQSVVSAAVKRPSFDADAPSMSLGAEAWSQLCATLDELARLQARAVVLAGRVARSGTIERVEGVTLDTALSLTHRLPGCDRSMLLTAADVLADMPVTRRLFAAGGLSWGQVRGIVAEAKRLSRAQRGLVDERVALSQDRLAGMDPDDAVDAVRVAVAELRDPRSVQRGEAGRARRNFVWVQPGMFDRGKVYGELDNCSLAAVVTGMDAAAPADDGRSVAQRRADGLVALATHRCDLAECTNPDCGDCRDTTTAAGADTPPAKDAPSADTQPAAGAAAAASAAAGVGGPDQRGVAASLGSRCRRRPVIGRAVPAFTVVVDMREVSVNAAGVVQINVPGCVPTMSAALVESLAADASVRAVVCEGARPLTVTRKVWASRLPDDVRLAVRVRDGGDRFPGSRRPIEHVHHFDRDGAGHHVDQLAGLSGRSHRRIHRHQWQITLDPASGKMTFRRGDRTWVTLPRGTRLRRPPPADDEPAA